MRILLITVMICSGEIVKMPTVLICVHGQQNPDTWPADLNYSIHGEELVTEFSDRRQFKCDCDHGYTGKWCERRLEGGVIIKEVTTPSLTSRASLENNFGDTIKSNAPDTKLQIGPNVIGVAIILIILLCAIAISIFAYQQCTKKKKLSKPTETLLMARIEAHYQISFERLVPFDESCLLGSGAFGFSETFHVGHYGIVYKCVLQPSSPTEKAKDVACKVLKAITDTSIEDFNKEAEIMSLLK